MKKVILTALVAAAATPAMIAQSAVEALQLSPSEFTGTARYMGMGGAFTALGGDLSSLLQNPAGIGVYRRSEIGLTLDLSFNNTSTAGSLSNSKTNFACNNFGYVGVTNLDGAMKTFSWGASYNRRAQFDRVTSGYANPTATSLTNYIASFSQGYSESELGFDNSAGYNPYQNSDMDWLSALAYNSYLINPKSGSTNTYTGLYQNGTEADAQINVYESGYIDEYNISFGGNIQNTVYWGLGIGITDMQYKRFTSYSESLSGASVYSESRGGLVNGDAGFELGNSKRITGTGWDLKFGLIVKPINELRIGASIHTPRYWTLNEDYEATVDYSFYDSSAAQGSTNPTTGSEYTDYASFDWRLRSPWRFNLGAAAVLGGEAIFSVEYERKAYNDMNVKNAVYDTWGGGGYYQDNVNVNENISSYTKAGNIVRAGFEYRVTPQLSIRAGYNVELTNIQNEVANNQVEVVTASTDPSYSLNNTTQHATLGLGYRFGSCYIDGAYVYGNRKSTLHPYTSFTGGDAPVFDVTDETNSIVVTFGIKF